MHISRLQYIGEKLIPVLTNASFLPKKCVSGHNPLTNCLASTSLKEMDAATARMPCGHFKGVNTGDLYTGPSWVLSEVFFSQKVEGWEIKERLVVVVFQTLRKLVKF